VSSSAQSQSHGAAAVAPATAPAAALVADTVNGSNSTAAHDDVEESDVNDMLVRSLGWVQLPSDKENTFQKVTDALQGLGVDYSVVRGEFSDFVEVNLNETGESGQIDVTDLVTSGAPAPESSDTLRPPGTCLAGQLTVRMHIKSKQNGAHSDIHIARQKGPVLQFHSFYADIKNELAGINGWSQSLGRYHRTSQEPSHA